MRPHVLVLLVARESTAIDVTKVYKCTKYAFYRPRRPKLTAFKIADTRATFKLATDFQLSYENS